MKTFAEQHQSRSLAARKPRLVNEVPHQLQLIRVICGPDTIVANVSPLIRRQIPSLKMPFILDDPKK